MNQPPPNPFAEDPQLVQASAAQPAVPPRLDAPQALNPYAAPAAVADVATGACGHWNDKGALLLHRDAVAPPICIKCGCDTERLEQYALRWSRPIDLAHWTLSLQLGLCGACRKRVFWAQVVASVSGLAAFGLMGFGGLLGVTLDPNFPAWGGFGLGVLLALPLAYLSHQNNRIVLHLKVVRAGPPYFWLSGLGPDFLARLPSPDER